MSWPWSQLGLPGPSDLSQVRHAYAEKLKTTHPEEDPEGFQRLHSAYQLASRMARQSRRQERRAPTPKERPAPPPQSPKEEKRFDFEQLLQDGEERPRLTQEEEQDFDFEKLLQDTDGRPRLSREEERDFDFDQLLDEDGAPFRARQDEEVQDWDFDRLFAEGEAERAEARRRRGEERRRARERERQEYLRQEQERRAAYEQARREQFDQEQLKWQNTEAILHTIEMMVNSRAEGEAWEKFFLGPLFQQMKNSIDLVFGLEDFVSTRQDMSQSARVALFRAYGFDKGVSRPELRPLYQMLLGSWQAARAKKRKGWLLNALAVPVTLVLIYVAAVILMSPLLIVFILLGLVAVYGLNKGWLKREPKAPPLNCGKSMWVRVGLYALVSILGLTVVGMLTFLPEMWGETRAMLSVSDPREQVCRYLELDYGEEFCSVYNENSPDKRFDNVFSPKNEAGKMFLAGPDGERGNGNLGYTTNYPEMKLFWRLKEFAEAQGIYSVGSVDRLQGLEHWETSGTYLVALPFWGAGEVITQLGELLEELSEEDWYQVRPPEFEIVLCSSQLKEGRLILYQHKSGEEFDAGEVRELYETSFASAYCAQLLREEGLDRDFVHGGEETYNLADAGMARMKDGEYCKLLGLDAEGRTAMEYYISTAGGSVLCVPGGYWEEGGTEDGIQFYRLISRGDVGGMLSVYYPWITVY